jgi:exosortase
MIFTQEKSSRAVALAPIAFVVLILIVGFNKEALLHHRDHLSIITALFVLIWIGGFTFCYGVASTQAAIFPLLFLFFMVPIPNIILDPFISFLQAGSAEVAYVFLKTAGIPMTREGNVFHLITVDIEVAKECSGIRSSLSLVITGLLAGYFFLRTGWAKLVLLAAMLPITILKNGFRIATLSILGVYVDERILASDLHTRGGILFFILALILVWGIIVLLRKMEGSSIIEPQNREGRKVTG